MLRSCLSKLYLYPRSKEFLLLTTRRRKRVWLLTITTRLNKRKLTDQFISPVNIQRWLPT